MQRSANLKLLSLKFVQEEKKSAFIKGVIFCLTVIITWSFEGLFRDQNGSSLCCLDWRGRWGCRRCGGLHRLFRRGLQRCGRRRLRGFLLFVRFVDQNRFLVRHVEHFILVVLEKRPNIKLAFPSNVPSYLRFHFLFGDLFGRKILMYFRRDFSPWRDGVRNGVFLVRFGRGRTRVVNLEVFRRSRTSVGEQLRMNGNRARGEAVTPETNKKDR